MRRSFPIILFVLCACLTACASSGAPVSDLYTFYRQHKPATEPVTQGSYTVKPGDTLYAVAFRYGWNFHDLAAANGIRAPYTIYPGEVIRFDRAVPAAHVSSGREANSHKADKRTSSSKSKPRKTVKRQPAPRSSPSLPKGKPHWQWPARGKVVTKFGHKDSLKGITIGGQKGSAVRAAATGVVVYRGHNVSGYGNLLIIKHNAHWLSAYAHNASMRVKEGDKVKAGEKIATLGDSGSWRAGLYFEIRKNGKPVNPVKLLPHR